MSKVHLISNAHLDPIWQWEWEEGCAAAISTFRCAARFCREFDGYIFCHNESLIYRWVEEYEPPLFKEIQELVKLGKWHIMGGWHVQPDCNMPSGEGFARQVTEGRRYFKEKFGVEPTTAINFDPFGHTRGLVQILAKTGYDSYLFCRPDPGNLKLEEETFEWVGYDGSKVLAQRSASGYNTLLGHATDKIRPVCEETKTGQPLSYCLWGVGDHGGGPSRVDIRMINEYIEEAKKQGIEVIHSTPEAYFADVKEDMKKGRKLPLHKGDLNSWGPGCYTSQVRIKQKYRHTESLLFETEKMVSQTVALGRMDYPEKEFGEVLYDLLTVQFHDVLPGSSIQAAEDMALRMLDHAEEYLVRIRNKAFLLLAEGQPEAKEGEIPILVYNPHPYPVEDDISCEFMLADQNWSNTFTMPTAYQNGKALPSQCEKERSNLPLDWRKRVVFHARLNPMSMNRFDCRLTTLPEKPKVIPDCSCDDKICVNMSIPKMTVSFDKKTGLIREWVVDGVNYLSEGAGALDVMWDLNDSWGMTQQSYRNKLGQFEMLSDEEGSKFSDLDTVIPSIRFIESGTVRTVVEVVYGFEDSKAVIRYMISATEPRIDLNVRVINATKRRMIKLALPVAFDSPEPSQEVAFGEEPMHTDGKECVGQKYLTVTGEKGERLTVLNQGIYGSSFEDGTIRLTLLHSPGYTAHPIGDRVVMPQDRHSDHMEQGERIYDFRLIAGKAEDSCMAREALTYNEQPVALSFFPSGLETEQGTGDAPFLTLSEKSPVTVTALKRTVDGKDWLLRLFNPTDNPVEEHVACKTLNLDEKLAFGPFEVQTYRVSDGKLIPSRMDEINE